MSVVPIEKVAAEVADRCNNPGLEAVLRLYLSVIEREGFTIIRDEMPKG